MPELLETNDPDTRVFGIIAKTQRIPIESISLDSTFEDLKIDSLDGINLVFELENAFDVAIPDDGVQNMHSVRDTVEGIRKLLAQKSRSASSTGEAV